jgi:hypothetical protein
METKLKEIFIKIVPDKKNPDKFIGLYREKVGLKEIETGRGTKLVDKYSFTICFFDKDCNHSAFKEGEIWKANIIKETDIKGKLFYTVFPFEPIEF